MRLTMHVRHALVRELSSRFQLSGKKERSAILNNFVELTGYTRCYAAYVLRTCGRKQVRLRRGKRIVFIPGYARRPGAKRHRTGGATAPEPSWRLSGSSGPSPTGSVANAWWPS